MGQSELHGPQGRVVLASLALAEGPVAAAELAERVWDGREPPAWEGALRVVVHRVRSALRAVTSHDDPVPYRDGCYELRPADGWVDVRAARALLHHAEARFAAGEGSAGSLAHAAACIARRPFLPGIEGRWVEEYRRRLGALRGRSLRCLAEAWLELGNAAGAAMLAGEAFELDRASTRTTLVLVRAQLAAGEGAHALESLDAHLAAVRPLGLGFAPELGALRRRALAWRARPRDSNAPPTGP